MKHPSLLIKEARETYEALERKHNNLFHRFFSRYINHGERVRLRRAVRNLHRIQDLTFVLNPEYIEDARALENDFYLYLLDRVKPNHHEKIFKGRKVYEALKPISQQCL